LTIEIWLENVIRQLIFYSLPVLISLTSVALTESKLTRHSLSHPFYAISWAGSWLPCIAAIFFGRGVIISLPQPLQSGSRAAMYRCLTHLTLCALGFLLYSWSLNHQPPTGLPPLHHWWAKLLMYFNLCMFCLHLLPLPGQWVGELLLNASPKTISAREIITRYQVLIYMPLAASPLLDWMLGSDVIFPIYENLANLASAW
jgi:hypothetical protein